MNNSPESDKSVFFKTLVCRVQVSNAEKILTEIKASMLFDNSYKIKRDKHFLLIPIRYETPIYHCEFQVMEKSKFIKVQYSSRLPNTYPKYEIFGSICILTYNEPEIAKIEFEPTEFIEYIKDLHPQVDTLVKRNGFVDGKFRIRKHKMLLGSSFRTIYQENNLRYELDINKVYFSPRLSSERLFLANQMNSFDSCLVLFAGVGPIPITLARYSTLNKIVAVEKNPEAIKFLRQNIVRNKIKKILVEVADAEEYTNHEFYDCVIIATPKYENQNYEFLRNIKPILIKSQLIIIYMFSNHPSNPEEQLKILHQQLGEITIQNIRKCGSVGKHLYRTAISFSIIF